MATVNLHSFPFVLHIVLEIPAVIAFALFPSATLRSPQPDAHAVIRQYALSLLTTVLIASIFAFGPYNPHATDPHAGRLERQVAGALGLYHVGPLIRAGYRLWYANEKSYRMIRMPCLHFLCHVVGGMVLAGRAYDVW